LEQLVELKLAGETEVLGENLPQRHFVQRQRVALVGTYQGMGSNPQDRSIYFPRILVNYSKQAVEYTVISHDKLSHTSKELICSVSYVTMLPYNKMNDD
jgi:hypothetical protein